jgi:Toprim-like
VGGGVVVTFRTGLQSLIDKDIYRSYLDRLDARALLAHYGAQRCTEQTNKDGSTEIVHSCLLDRVERHHSHGDQNPSAACNIDKHTYVCYAMGFGCDLFHLVMKLEGKENFADALSAVNPFLTGSTLEGNALRTKLDKLFAGPVAYTIELPTYDIRVLDAWKVDHPYWWHRGISAEAIALLRLGFDAHENRIVFPHFVGGKLVGWQKRVVPGLTNPPFPKYRNSSGFPKSETLYAHDLTDLGDGPVYPGGPVLVVESPMSVARAYTIGLRNVVATFGAKVSVAQIELLKKHEKVIVWFDADPAGMTGERHLLEGLQCHTEVLRVRPEEGKDLADYDMDGFCRHTALNTMTAMVRLGEIRRNRGR